MPETLTKLPPPDVEAAAPPVPHALLSLCLPDDWMLDDAALEQLDELNPGWRIERGFSGELVINMGAGGWCSWICIRLGARLEIWSEDIGGGVAEDSQAGYNLLDDAGPQSRVGTGCLLDQPGTAGVCRGISAAPRLLEPVPRLCR